MKIIQTSNISAAKLFYFLLTKHGTKKEHKESIGKYYQFLYLKFLVNSQKIKFYRYHSLNFLQSV